MRSALCLAIAVAAIGPIYAGEQQVFKCKKADGSVVFLPQPCGAGAQEQKVRVTPHGTDAAPPSAPVENTAIRDISDSVADSRCRDDARRLYVEPDTSAIARAEAEIRQIQGRQWVGGTASSRVLAEQNDETHIASLRSLIATEQSRADDTRAESRRRMDAAMATCDTQKAQREASHR